MAEKATPSAPDLRGLAEKWKAMAVLMPGLHTSAQLVECADELLAALVIPQDGARSIWRPIESAPRGGMWVRVLGWNGYEVDIFTHDEFWRYAGDGGRIVPQPTHWMPLPAPPVAAARPSGEQEGQ